jgi:hypothetical protein
MTFVRCPLGAVAGLRTGQVAAGTRAVPGLDVAAVAGSVRDQAARGTSSLFVSLVPPDVEARNSCQLEAPLRNRVRYPSV